MKLDMSEAQKSSDNKTQSAGQLARHTIIYGLGSAISAAGSFVLIPLYTNMLSTTDYGLLEILNRLAEIIILLTFLGTRQAYLRFFFDRNDLAWHKTVTATTLAFSLGMSVLFLVLAYVAYLINPDVFLIDGASSRLYLLLAAWMPFEILFSVSMTYLRVNLLSKLFVAVNAIKLVLFVSLNVLFMYVLKLGVESVFISQLLATGIIGLIFFVYFWKWSGFRIDPELLKKLLKFGLPFLPATGFAFIIANADRFFLNSYYSLATVGLLALGTKIGTIGITLFMRPFNMVWAPYIFDVYTSDSGGEQIGSAFTVYTALSAYLALGVSLAGPIVINLIAEEQYQVASTIVPIVAIGAVFLGMAMLIDAGILITKQTKYKPVIFGSAALLGVLFHLILTSRFGLVGASISTSLTFAVLFLINYRVSEMFYHIDLYIRDFVAIAVSFIVPYAIFSLLLQLVGSLIAKTVLLIMAAAAFPALFLLMSRYTWLDIQELFIEFRGGHNK